MGYAAVVALSIAGGGSLAAQEMAPAAPVATVDQAVDLAINTQPEVQARWEAFLAAGADRRAVRGGYLPTVDVNGEYGAATREYDDRGWFARDYVELSITQMLFDGFLVRSQLEEADQTRLTRYYELLDEVQSKALEAIEAYEDVRQYRETLALAQRNYETHQQVHALISERAQSGVSNRADLEQAAGRLALAESNMLTEQANLHDVTARFQRIVGRQPAEALQDFPVASARVPGDLEAVMTEALRNHASLYAANATVEAAKAAVSESRAAYYPRVSVAARGGTYRNSSSFDAQFDPRGRGEEAFVGLNFSYNLFRGGADQARTDAAERRLFQSEDLLDKACVDLRQSASIAWNNVNSLRARLRALEAHRIGAANVATAYEQQFYIGRRTLLDVLDAKNEAFQAERAFAQAQHELTKAYYRTLRAMGILLDVLGQTRSGMPSISEFDDDAQRPTSIDCPGAIASAS
ncbi:TolC family outer membrane protein [Sphingosinicella terrae]|uniref:TolC family outer membrane protein n=1 Tax=Sphingosinicella terrae TaxID=2172047 RepID=UPI000E0DBA73|nr:TolC family outer membrane protein [Sphingosinicella terrae]